MKFSKLTWFITATAFTTAGAIGAVACSDSTTGTSSGVTPGKDSGTSTDSGMKSDSTVTPNDGGTTTDGGGVCPNPASLRSSPDHASYCPFVVRPDGGADGGDGGSSSSCANGSTCCAGQKNPAAPTGYDNTVCAVGTVDKCPAPGNVAFKPQGYECTESNDCPANNVCCVNPMKAGVKPSLDTYLGCDTLKGDFGTRCHATCGADEIQGCESDAECGAGKTCKPVNVGPGSSKTKAGQIFMGICQ